MHSCPAMVWLSVACKLSQCILLCIKHTLFTCTAALLHITLLIESCPGWWSILQGSTLFVECPSSISTFSADTTSFLATSKDISVLLGFLGVQWLVVLVFAVKQFAVISFAIVSNNVLLVSLTFCNHYFMSNPTLVLYWWRRLAYESTERNKFVWCFPQLQGEVSYPPLWGDPPSVVPPTVIFCPFNKLLAVTTAFRKKPIPTIISTTDALFQALKSYWMIGESQSDSI